MELMAFQILESHTEQNRALVETVQALSESLARQAEASQRQIQAILDVWNQPIPERETPLRTMREAELLRDLSREANNGHVDAAEMLKPENKEQLEEYLSLFRES